MSVPRIYVSEVIEELIDGAGIRDLVRAQCGQVLRELPAPIAQKLQKHLQYSAGKCMGYPAVWLVQQALEKSVEQTASLLAEAPAPLYVSLTTSIADDFLDRDPNVDGGHMMMLYMFMFGALSERPWFHGEQRRQWLDRVFPLVATFVEPSDIVSAGSSRDAVEASGRRIGAFFEVIAYSLTGGILAERRRELVELAGKFGNWCSHLDDIVDIEIDIIDGAHLTFPVWAIAQHSEAHRQAVGARNLDGCASLIASAEFVDYLIDRQLERLQELKRCAQTGGFNLLVTCLERVSGRLPETVHALRRKLQRSQVTAPIRIHHAEQSCA
jgi:hypothetical protein